MLTIRELGRGYALRTKHNVVNSDFTIMVAKDYTTAGERLTERLSGTKGIKLSFDLSSLDAANNFYKFIKNKNNIALNIAGNGIHTFQKFNITQKEINIWMFTFIFHLVNDYAITINKIISGGQTGADISAAVVSDIFKIPCELTFPIGLLQRTVDGIDIKNTEKNIQEDITKMVNELCI